MNLKKFFIILFIGGLIITSCKSSDKEKSKVNTEEKIVQITTNIEKKDENIDSIGEIKTNQNTDTIISSQNSTIEWRKLTIETVEKIDEHNDSIIDTEEKPNIEESKLVFRVTSTPALFQNLPQDWIEFSEKQVNDYMERNQITDNHYKSKRFAVVRENKNFFVREYLTEVGYYFVEGGGVRKRVAIIGEDTIKWNNIFLMFSEGFIFPKREIRLVEIESKDRGFILPDNEIVYKDSSEHITISYKGILNKGTFQHKGMGTISPIYVNVTLSVENSETGEKQELYKLPYTFFEGLRRIVLLDINRDNCKDIILEIEDELSGHRLLFLSKLEDKKVHYDYIGIMETFRDDP